MNWLDLGFAGQWAFCWAVGMLSEARSSGAMLKVPSEWFPKALMSGRCESGVTGIGGASTGGGATGAGGVDGVAVGAVAALVMVFGAGMLTACPSGWSDQNACRHPKCGSRVFLKMPGVTTHFVGMRSCWDPVSEVILAWRCVRASAGSH